MSNRRTYPGATACTVFSGRCFRRPRNVESERFDPYACGQLRFNELRLRNTKPILAQLEIGESSFGVWESYIHTMGLSTLVFE
jgi:hypothetical protein